jgi:hypothetical protein
MKKLEEVIREHVLYVYKACECNQSKTAIVLGVSVKTVRKHLQNCRYDGVAVPVKKEFNLLDDQLRVNTKVNKETNEVEAEIEYHYHGFATNEQRLLWLDRQIKPHHQQE